MILKDVVFVYQMNDSENIQWHTRHHKHDPEEYEVHYFLQGEGEFVNRSKSYILANGEFFITGPEETHWINPTNLTRPITYYAVLFHLEKNDQPLKDFLDNELLPKRQLNIGTNFRFFFEGIKEKGMSPVTNMQLAGAHEFISFLYMLSVSPHRLNASDSASLHIERALRIMQENVFTDLSLTDISERLALSEAHVIRLFKNKMNLTPMKYMMRLKIEAATSLLTSTTDSLAEIADKLNFSSEFHFSRAFKQITKIAPSHYRNQYFQKAEISQSDYQKNK